MTSTMALPDMKPVGAGDPFSFYTLPRLLLTSKKFKGLHKLAAVLYGMMLSRLALSARREDEFTDAEGRLYILYTIDQVQSDLRCARATAVKLMRQLVEYGLLEKKRRGQGKPNLLFVKDFREAEKVVDAAEVTKKEKKKAHKEGEMHNRNEVNFQKLKILTSRNQGFLPPEVQNVDSKYIDQSKLDLRILPSPLTPHPVERQERKEGWKEKISSFKNKLRTKGEVCPFHPKIKNALQKWLERR